MKTERLQIRIDPQLKVRADRLARRTNTTLSALIIDLLKSRVEAADIESRIPRGEDAEQV